MSASGVNLEKYLIPLEEINRATENFSPQRRIGGGGFGTVYKGQLSESWQHRTVAIKRLNRDNKQGEREFRDELEMISRFHHENIISFIGYCDQDNEMIIVYDYAVNGSLDHHLGDPHKMRCMTWTQRLKICIEAAKGLDYLHSGLGEHNRVIHRDVKSANILLGDNLIAKICDFGLSKSGARNQPDTQLHTRVAGTQFYMDPSYHESRILQKESDVYSFGVVLFEMLSGMLVYHQSRFGDDQKQFLITAIRQFYDRPEKLIDPHITHEIDGPSFDMFKDVAYQCVSLDSVERPTMDEVVKRIEQALTIQTSVQSKIRSLIHKLDSFTDQRTTLSELWNGNHKYLFKTLELEGWLLRNLYSVIPTNKRTTLCEIYNVSYENERDSLDIAEAGAIPLIRDILRASDALTQEYAVIALYGLSISEKNRHSIVSSGAVPGIIHVLSEGSMEAREIAAATLQVLIETVKNKVTIGATGAIPPLVLLLSEGSQSGKKNAALALGLLIRYKVNIEYAVRAGVVPVLIELLTEPEGDLKDATIANLSIISHHAQGRLAMCKAKVVPVLVELIWSGSPKSKEYATALLKRLCHEDQECLVEARELRECVLRKLHSVIPTDCNRVYIAEAGAIPLTTDLLTASDSLTQELAVTASYILSIHDDNRGSIVSSGVVPGIIHVLSEGSMEAREKAATTLYRLSIIEENQVTIGDAGAIPPLVLLLSEGTQSGKKTAADALGFLCYYEGNRGRAVGAGVVPILMDLLTEPEGDLKDAAITILAFLSVHPEGRLAICEAEAVPVLVQLIGSGSRPKNRGNAAAILMELCSEEEKYLVEAQELGVMKKLMDLEQNGTDRGKTTARQLMEKIRQAERQTVAAEHGLGRRLLEKIIQICSLRF